ncbi:hypothetical protein GCM10020220_079760 [Nonomuraea rubra]|uniref:NADH-quinone oxidoreductase subunit NuoH n=1 Tax=Nonomuraea rubra TaxID=46180 RepID=UPI0031F07E3B
MLEVVLSFVVILAVFLVLPLIVGQTEHKVMAHMQSRLGPMYAGGFHGWAQLIADGVKFAQKEDVVPAAADRRIFMIAPGVALIPYLVVLIAIPIDRDRVAVNLDLGLFFVLAVMGIGVLGSIMAGWASANKYSVLGGMRSAAQLMSYELPLVLSASSVAMAAGTLSLPGIVEAWQWWWLPWQAIGAIVFFLAGLAELRRPPFDMPIAESEIIMGPMTEYTGMRFALFMLSEYAGIVVLSFLTTVLFLGGWQGPFLPGWLWTLLKVFFLAFIVIWLRVTYPRLREDQLQKLAWAVLVPLALAQLAPNRHRQSPHLTAASSRALPTRNPASPRLPLTPEQDPHPCPGTTRTCPPTPHVGPHPNPPSATQHPEEPLCPPYSSYQNKGALRGTTSEPTPTMRRRHKRQPSPTNNPDLHPPITDGHRQCLG